MAGQVQPIGLVFITMRERFLCNLKEVRVLVNARDLVKSSEGNTNPQTISSSVVCCV